MDRYTARVTRAAAKRMARDSWARRECHPVTDESVWIGRVWVRVVRWKHWSNWTVAGDLDDAPGECRERVADFIRSRAGLVRCVGAHEFVLLQVWHARTGLRGGLVGRKTGNLWTGVIHVVSY
jgi:hypothetical protein